MTHKDIHEDMKRTALHIQLLRDGLLMPQDAVSETQIKGLRHVIKNGTIVIIQYIENIPPHPQRTKQMASVGKAMASTANKTTKFANEIFLLQESIASNCHVSSYSA